MFYRVKNLWSAFFGCLFFKAAMFILRVLLLVAGRQSVHVGEF